MLFAGMVGWLNTKRMNMRVLLKDQTDSDPEHGGSLAMALQSTLRLLMRELMIPYPAPRSSVHSGACLK